MDNLRGHEGGTLISWLSTLGNYLCVPKGSRCVLEEGRQKEQDSEVMYLLYREYNRPIVTDNNSEAQAMKYWTYLLLQFRKINMNTINFP